MGKEFDVVIIGGGFYGLSLAGSYLEKGCSVCVVERESELMTRASYNNQARVHNGYHYPRSLLTGLRSRILLPKFTSKYKEAVVDTFDNYYAIGRKMSKVTSRQFKSFCDTIGAYCEEASPRVKSMFSDYFIDDVFLTKEYAFDSHVLRKLVLEDLSKYQLSIEYGSTAKKIEKKIVSYLFLVLLKIALKNC